MTPLTAACTLLNDTGMTGEFFPIKIAEYV
jgi:hypothetical protein